MDWTETAVYTSTEGLDSVCAALTALGVNGFAIEDAQDFSDFLEQVTPRWDYVDEKLLEKRDAETRVTVWLPKNEQGRTQLAALDEALARLRALDTAGRWGRLVRACTDCRDEDWANNWKQYFHPFPVGERLAVKPSWEALPPALAGRRVLEIDPGSAFGTGTHHTTRLCLEALETALRPGDRVLDMGCGSGILSAGALLLGAAHVTAVDVDEAAVATARENVEKNGFGPERLETHAGNALTSPALRARLEGRGFDLIAANIVADVLIAMGGLFAASLRPGGTLLVSGIIAERADEVTQALRAAGFASPRERRSGGWAAVTLRKEN